MINGIDLFILGLATWRLSSLLAVEDGPWNIFPNLRHFLGVRYGNSPPFEAYGTNVVSSGILCIWCNSIWIGVLFTLAHLMFPGTILFLMPLSLSTMAIIVAKVLQETKGD